MKTSGVICNLAVDIVHNSTREDKPKVTPSEQRRFFILGSFCNLSMYTIILRRAQFEIRILMMQMTENRGSCPTNCPENNIIVLCERTIQNSIIRRIDVEVYHNTVASSYGHVGTFVDDTNQGVTDSTLVGAASGPRPNL